MPHGGLEERVEAWLESESGTEVPDWLLAAVFAQTRSMPQQRGARQRLARLAERLASLVRLGDGPAQRLPVGSRIVVTALVVIAVVLGSVVAIPAVFRPAPAPAPGVQAALAQPETLAELTLDGDAIPEDLAGILFFRKTYPTDQEISFGRGFVPPNTFVRHVESGSLAITPRSAVQIIRAGTTWAEAEVVAAGKEALIGPGDTFVMQDVPYDLLGSEALGTMATPGEDARVVGFAIRESSRCCAMTHAGMQSPWYHTLLQGIQELRGDPVSLRITRWEVPPGAALPPLEHGTLALRAVDAGTISGTVVPPAAASAVVEPRALTFGAGNAIQLPRTLEDGDTVQLSNDGPEPAVVYQLTVEAGPTLTPTPAPATAVVMESGPMLSARSGHSATVLANGRVLLAGGGCEAVEVYDPATGTSEPAGEMGSIRSGTTTLLADSRVLLAGGDDGPGEVYDPRLNEVVPVGAMGEERHNASATRLMDGRVLVTGGETAAAEVFDPETDTFTPTGSMGTVRSRHVSVLLRDGRVLVAGGGDPVAELYDPTSGRFDPSAADGLQAFDRGTATRLADGRVLLIGHGAPAQLYDPETDTATSLGPMATPRYSHAAVLLDDGRVLLVGGMDAETLAATASLEVFDPRTLTFEDAGSLAMARWQPAAAKICSGQILVTGGTTGTAPTVSAELIAVNSVR